MRVFLNEPRWRHSYSTNAAPFPQLPVLLRQLAAQFTRLLVLPGVQKQIVELSG
jgi:hypothetical protein